MFDRIKGLKKILITLVILFGYVSLFVLYSGKTHFSPSTCTSMDVERNEENPPLCSKNGRPWLRIVQQYAFKPENSVQRDMSTYHYLKDNWDIYVQPGRKSQSKCSAEFPFLAGEDYSLFFRKISDYYSSNIYSAFCPVLLRVGEGMHGKLLCDVLTCRQCVIYSLGSQNQFQFEEAALREYGCQIHTFDCTVKTAAPPRGVDFHPWCIGKSDEMKFNKQFYTIETIMKKLNHPTIEVLKIDIERYEFEVVESLSSMLPSSLPRQLTIEVHLMPTGGEFRQYVTFEEHDELWNTLRGIGYRVVSHEMNPACKCCCEYTLLRDPTVW